MSKHHALQNIYQRKLAVSVAYIVLVSLLTSMLFYPEMSYFHGVNHLFFEIFLAIYIYGIWASLLSDVLASILSDRTRIREVYGSAFFHIGAGALFGLGTMAIAVSFFLLDRFFMKYIKVNWTIPFICFGILVLIFILNLNNYFPS
ncbi:hypothetical protein IQ283_18055 [Alkalihalobacillus hwajinpoensis]|uniref:hypothetical protein n=1 Tax=Guptibacillus hwajinpoensis TaxID=208199 RepID=UPI00188377C3|nr:hypothetical protein [Pseudalkalibacillus hwajinpoensis]MBF0708512.1 hypothetical protein [Pseudalkalibacillus hwajinpoensis]